MFQFDYILWTGDLPGHNVWNQTRSDQLHLLDYLHKLLNQYFPHTPVYSTLGNHESTPVNRSGAGTVVLSFNGFPTRMIGAVWKYIIINWRLTNFSSTTSWLALLILHCNPALWLPETPSLVFKQCRNKVLMHSLVFISRWPTLWWKTSKTKWL